MGETQVASLLPRRPHTDTPTAAGRDGPEMREETKLTCERSGEARRGGRKHGPAGDKMVRMQVFSSSSSSSSSLPPTGENSVH